jgi:hypothetical protein
MVLSSDSKLAFKIQLLRFNLQLNSSFREILLCRNVRYKSESKDVAFSHASQLFWHSYDYLPFRRIENA